MQVEVFNRRLLGLFSDALVRGGASGAPGELNIGGVSTVALDAAIATAAELGVATEEVDRLLQSAKLVRRLRAVQVWEGRRGFQPLLPHLLPPHHLLSWRATGSGSAPCCSRRARCATPSRPSLSASYSWRRSAEHGGAG